MEIELNGNPHQVPEQTTVADLVQGVAQRGVAVAVDGAVVPRSRHHEVLRPGARVEVVTAVQGG